MKAIIKEPNSLVKLANLPEPLFLPSQDSENIIVQVKFVGICRTDIFVAHGAIPVQTPIILGHEFSAVVIEAGSKSGFSPSDKVADAMGREIAKPKEVRSLLNLTLGG